MDTAKETDRPALVDAIPEVLDQLASTLGSGSAGDLVQGRSALAVHHGKQRAELHEYSLEKVILEYQLLRQALLDILDEGGPIDAATRDLISDTILVAVRTAANEFARLRAAATVVELRETGLRFRHMVEAVKDYAIFTVDPGGHITSWNEGCVRMKLYTVEEAMGQHFAMLYPEEGRRRNEPDSHLRAAAIEGRFRGEGVRVRKNGEKFLADVSITAIFDGSDLTGFTKVVQDLTERNALVQERDLSRTDSERLRAEAEYRERFVATLTHDLRSPLTAARAGADLIAQYPEDSENVRAWAKRSADALERADQMIANLLDASRFNAGGDFPLDLERCDLGLLAHELVADLADRHGDRFTVLVDGTPVGYWSPSGLRRVVDNLLSNAIKYGDGDKPITIRIRTVADRVLVSVHNSGTIIPVEEQAKLFQPFHRAPTAEISGTPGWGIGLAIVKGIVEAHHGIVKAESYPKEGTTFTLDLPMDARAPSERA